MREFVPFVDRRLEVRWTDEMGHGVFAKAPIPKDAFVEIAPVVVFDPKELAGGELANYTMAWRDKLAVGLGWTMVYNHSDANNCEFSVNYHDDLMAIMAVRDIEAGEQLTVNYGPTWFSSRNMEKRQL